MTEPTNAFDSFAQSYDHDFTHTVIGQWLRQRVQTRLLEILPMGAQVLEVGCGTGVDALFLAQHGYQVTATDISQAMLAQARLKAQATTASIHFATLDLSNLPDEWPATYDAVFSNFGALNCVANWSELAVWLAKRIKPGGLAGFMIMPPLCVWETLWHGIHANLKTATRRWRQPRFTGETSQASINIHYPTVRRFSQAFAPHFERTSVKPMGLFLPPSDIYGVVEKREWLLKRCLGLEEAFSHVAQLANFADHYWIEMRRTG